MEEPIMKEFKQLTSMNDIDQFIEQNQLSFIYISRPGCSVCHGLLPQVQSLMEKYPKIQLGHVDAEEVEAIAGRFSIFTVPVLLLFVDGKEYVREADRKSTRLNSSHVSISYAVFCLKTKTTQE